MPPLWQILLIYALGMAGILYVITILPGKRKNKQVRAMHDSVAVSYTHLTLPTIYSV